MVRMAVRDDEGCDPFGNLPSDRCEALDQLSVRETRVDQDGGGPGLQEKRVTLTAASEDRDPHEEPRAQLSSLGKTLDLHHPIIGARVPA